MELPHNELAMAINILIGLNSHGRAGVAQLVASLFSVGFVFLVLGPLNGGEVGVAVAVTFPLTVVYLTYLPHLVCSRIGVSTAQYFKSVMLRPIIHTLPFALCLIFCRMLFRENRLYEAVFVLVSGAVFLSVLYWRIVLPEKLKRTLVAKISSC